MPRGKQKNPVVKQAPVNPVVAVEAQAPEAPTRKPYPSIEERIVAADVKIAQLEALNASRQTLIERTEQLLADRREALGNSKEALQKAVAKRDRLIALKDKPPKPAPQNALTPEEKRQYNELINKIRSSGMSLDDVLARLKEDAPKP